MAISGERKPVWIADISTVTFGIHELKAKEPASTAKPESSKEKDAASAVETKYDAAADRPDLVIWNWKDPRLPSMQQVQERRDENFSFLCSWQPGTQKMVRLADPALRDVTLEPQQKHGVGVDIRDYELESNLDGRHFEDVYRVDPKTGERKLALRKLRWYLGASPDGTHFLYYDGGTFFSYDLTKGQSHDLTKGIPAVFYDTQDDHNVVEPPTHSFGWSKDSSSVLLSNNWDVWKVPADGGAATNLTANGKKEQIRYQAIWRLNPDDKGYDLSGSLYVKAYGEWSKKGGIGVLDPGKPGVRMLSWDNANYSTLLKAKRADTYLYSRETAQEFPDLYLSDAAPAAGKKVTDADPQQRNVLWTSGSKLIEYTNPKGARLQGAITCPRVIRPENTIRRSFIFMKSSPSWQTPTLMPTSAAASASDSIRAMATPYLLPISFTK